MRTKIASELRWDESVGFLDDAIRSDGAVAPLYLQPSFAEGSVYSAAMSTSLLAQVSASSSGALACSLRVCAAGSWAWWFGRERQRWDGRG